MDTLYRDNHRWNNTLHFLGHPVQRQPQVEQHITLPWTPCTETTTGGTTHYTSLDTLYRDNHMEQHITLPWTPCTETTTGGTTHCRDPPNKRWIILRTAQTMNIIARCKVGMQHNLQMVQKVCTFPSALLCHSIHATMERSLMTVHNIKPLVWQRT